MKLGRFIFILAGFVFFVTANSAGADSVDDLQERLKSQQNAIKNVESRIKEFKNNIQIKKREARSLEDQIDIIDDNIGQIRLSIEQTVAELENTNLEIENVRQEIEVKEEEIEHQKEILSQYLRSLYEANQQSTVTVFLKYSTFSEAVTETNALQELQDRSREVLIDVKNLRDELNKKRNSLEEFRETLSKLEEKQQGQQATLVSNRQSRENILDLTNSQESEFQKLLKESQKAHQAAEAEIKSLDAKIREELRRQGIGNLPSIGSLDWPVEPIFGVSCEFHCAGYPYAYLIGPHSGIDLPTYVGTPIKAPADGYVGRVRNANGPGYSYIMLIHGDNVSTVYGHVSGFNVAEGQMVTRGSVIGYTGGAAGSNGAGLSTGAHLHFEVRQNNVPINPRSYL